MVFCCDYLAAALLESFRWCNDSRCFSIIYKEKYWVFVSPLPNRVTEGLFCSIVLGMQFGNSVACLINVCPLIPATADGIKRNWIWQTEFMCCVWGTAKQPGEKSITANYASLSSHTNSAWSAWSTERASLWKDNTHQAQAPVMPWSDSRAGDVGTGEAAVKFQLSGPPPVLSFQVGGKRLLPSRESTWLWVAALSHCPLLCQGSGQRGQWTEVAVPPAEEASPIVFAVLFSRFGVLLHCGHTQ